MYDFSDMGTSCRASLRLNGHICKKGMAISIPNFAVIIIVREVARYHHPWSIQYADHVHSTISFNSFNHSLRQGLLFLLLK